MAQTRHIEMRNDERWGDVAEHFLRYCVEQQKFTTGGCHEGDPIPSSDGKQYAAISVPEHSAYLVRLLEEWATMEARSIKPDEPNA
jgi:hypothetical protein